MKKQPLQPGPSAAPAPSMRVLAQACGVSSMTVSRALRATDPTATATQRRVRDMAVKMGYRFNARMGRPRRTQPGAGRTGPACEIIVGTAIGGGNLYHTQLFGEIELTLRRHGYDCMIRMCDADYDNFILLCEALRRTRPQILMLIGWFHPARMQSLVSLAPHPILVDRHADAAAEQQCESISFDNAAAARLAVNHLLARGRNRILLIKGPCEHYFSIDIERGYRDVMESGGGRVDPALIRTADFTAGGARREIMAALAQGVQFDAVFTNDEMALGVLRALHDARIAVPGKVAVAGCDGLPIGAQAIPSLTTVALDYRQLGRLAAEHVLERQRHPQLPMCRIQLLPKLAVRESSGAGPSREQRCPNL